MTYTGESRDHTDDERDTFAPRGAATLYNAVKSKRIKTLRLVGLYDGDYNGEAPQSAAPTRPVSWAIASRARRAAHRRAVSAAPYRVAVAATLEHGRRGHRVDDLEVDVELRARRRCGEASEEVLSSRPAVVGRDLLRLEASAECQPRGAGAVAIQGLVYRTLELVAVVRREVANPGVEEYDLAVVVALTECDVTEPLTVTGVSKDDLEVERRRLGSGVGAGREGDGCERGRRRHCGRR